jgi:hypothetical protein
MAPDAALARAGDVHLLLHRSPACINSTEMQTHHAAAALLSGCWRTHLSNRARALLLPLHVLFIASVYRALQRYVSCMCDKLWCQANACLLY